MAVNQLNRIIDLELFDANGRTIYKLVCPRAGRKPNIHISALLTGTSTVSGFTVKVRNLYLDSTKEFASIKVIAGYEHSTAVAFIGSIQTIYQEEPGPESSVVIQCTVGSWRKWTEDTIELSMDEKYTISDALQKISNMAGLSAPVIGPGLTTVSPTKLLHQGSVSDAIRIIREQFPDVLVTYHDNRLYAWRSDGNNGMSAIKLEFMKTPPQAIAGENGLSWVNITSMWNPDVKPGSTVEFNSGYYKSKLRSSASSVSTMSVVSMSINFSTVGSDNQMVLQGSVK